MNDFNETPEHFLRKLTLIFGGSGTGKTTIVKHILFLLKNDIPLMFVISPTNDCNNSFTNIFPNHGLGNQANLDSFISFGSLL